MKRCEKHSLYYERMCGACVRENMQARSRVVRPGQGLQGINPTVIIHDEVDAELLKSLVSSKKLLRLNLAVKEGTEAHKAMENPKIYHSWNQAFKESNEMLTEASEQGRKYSDKMEVWGYISILAIATLILCVLAYLIQPKF